MPTAPFTVSVSRDVAAAPTTVYDLVSDITRMSRYSPETVETGWLDGAAAPRVGARFRGVNAIGRMRWTTKAEVTVADRGQCFAFRIPSGARSTWTYLLEPSGSGTRVTETVATERPIPVAIGFLSRLAGVTDRTEHLRTGITVTLDRLADAAIAAESHSALH